MVLPAGVTKGGGLRQALRAFGLSAHNAVAVGDAENDLTLLRSAELGVAVADAVPSLLEHADLVLERPDGAGVVDLLTGPVLAGRSPVWPARREVSIGVTDDGGVASVPGSQASLFVVGESGAGKSFLAGLLAERWIEAGYCVLVVDPEGDHIGLGERSDVVVLDGSDGLTSPLEVIGMLQRPGKSVVLDLSRVTRDVRLDYLNRLSPALAALRLGQGIPHWVVYEEAGEQARLAEEPYVAPGPGSCLVTWQPELLDDGARQVLDVTITLERSGGSSADSTSSGQPRGTLRLRRATRSFTVSKRQTHHVRHRHKYATVPLPPSRWFYFRDGDPADSTRAASTLEEFHDYLEHADASAIVYHAKRGDFSRWVGGTLADSTLGREIAGIERNLEASRALAVENARREIRRAVRRRYLQA